MDPIQLLGVLSNFAIFIPPPWGPLIGAIGQVAPLIGGGVEALAAINKADPALLQQLEAVAGQSFGGLDLSIVAKQLFAPHQMTAAERQAAEEAWFNRAAGDLG